MNYQTLTDLIRQVAAINIKVRKAENLRKANATRQLNLQRFRKVPAMFKDK